MIARLSFPTSVLPRSEAEVLLDRALWILRDVHADIAHPHAAAGPGDDDLRTRIDVLFALVAARRGAP
jgi:hypothetical protein